MYAVVQSLMELRQIQGLFKDGIVDILDFYSSSQAMAIPERDASRQDLDFPIAIYVVAVPAQHFIQEKKNPGITGGCGQTKNVREPLLKSSGQTVVIPANHELRGRFSSQGARPWLDQCTLQELQELPLKPDHLQRNKATNQDHPK